MISHAEHFIPCLQPLRRRRRVSFATSRQTGSYLVEVALALVVLGLCALTLFRVSATEIGVANRFDALDLQRRASRALIVFVQLHGRLPCVGDGNGKEDCASKATSGRLPHVTIGLPDPQAREMTYAIGEVALSTPAAGQYSVLTSTITDAGLSVTAASLPNASMGVSLCEALGRPAGGASSSTTPAFTLAANRLAASVGVIPALVTSRASLAEELDCASRSALAGRTYPDVAAAAGALAVSLADWRAQLEINRNIQNWDAAQSMWFCINSALTTFKPVIKMRLGMAKLAADSGASINGILTPAKQLPIAAAQAAAFTSNSARYVANIIQGAQILSRTAELEIEANELHAQIEKRARRAATDYLQIDGALNAAVGEVGAIHPTYLAEGGPLAAQTSAYADALDQFYSIAGITDFWKEKIQQPSLEQSMKQPQ